jgi:phosphatidylglycerol:prolipoprotein diacylglycerol transferase
MHPVLFELPGGLPVRSFGAMVALGFVVSAYWLWPRTLARFGADPARDPERSAAVALAILAGLLLGGRGLYVVVELLRHWTGDGSAVGARLAEAPWETLYIWKGGLVMYGGFGGAVALGAWSARRAGLALASALDTGLSCGFVGQAVGRVGCLLVGDDFGRVVPDQARDWPFPLTIRVPSREWLLDNPESLFPLELAGQTLWATQTWMSLSALALAAAGFWLLPRRRYPGQVAWCLALGYAVLRFAIECFRGDNVRGVWLDGALSTSQLISLPLALAAAIALARGAGRSA